MADPIRIEVTKLEDGIDLVEALAVRGLTGAMVGTDRRGDVKISYAREETERLLLEVVTALEDWLADRGGSSVRVGVGDRAYSVRRPERRAGSPLEEEGAVLALLEAGR